MASRVLLVCGLFALFVGLEAQQCPSQFTRVGKKCYYVSLTKANWHVAERGCRKLGAELVVFDNEHDLLLTTEYLKKLGLQFTDEWRHSVWVGINCLGIRRNFRSAKTGDVVGYMPWVPREPNNASPEEDCVGFANYNNAYGYHDIECKVEFPYVCEIPEINIQEDYLCLKRELFLEARL
ncbi:hypothetical protein KR026_008453 [Drosophila bipectinata]|nr:hypothetical protein KR026_008453 [Drosophila bipectinata]